MSIYNHNNHVYQLLIAVRTWEQNCPRYIIIIIIYILHYVNNN